MSLNLLLQAMPSMQIAPVSPHPPKSINSIDPQLRSTEVAVSLNTNEVQLLSRSGADWTPVETLSEVMSSCRSFRYTPPGSQ